MQKRLFAVALLLGLYGCAGEQAMRSVSSQSAAVLNQYRSSLTRFAQGQNELNAASEERVQRYNRRRDERLSEIELRKRAWRLEGNRDALARFEALTAQKAEAIMNSELVSPRTPETVEALRFDPAAVDAIIRRLIALQRPRSAFDHARDLLRFTQDLRTAFDAALEEAGRQSVDAAAQAGGAPG